MTGPISHGQRPGYCPVAPARPGYPGWGNQEHLVTYRPCWHGDPVTAPHPVGVRSHGRAVRAEVEVMRMCSARTGGADQDAEIRGAAVVAYLAGVAEERLGEITGAQVAEIRRWVLAYREREAKQGYPD